MSAADEPTPELPTFVVVGHVNKGKSSVVATLLEDPSIPIDLLPGTTTRTTSYAFRVDGQEVFRLLDTPGFQDAAAALAWLQEHAKQAAERPAALRRFVDTFADGERFHDEVELLRPLLAEGPVALLYVVDASRPYRPSHEAEMEILRWSGRPGMALMNRIGPGDHGAAWEAVLRQFFGAVRYFDAHHADPEHRLDLLRTFAALTDRSAQAIEAAITTLASRRQDLDQQAARLLAEDMLRLWSHVEGMPFTPDDKGQASAAALAELQAKYRQRLRQLEEASRHQIESLYGFPTLERQEAVLDPVPEDLFDRQGWKLFGLSRAQLTARLAAAGGVSGGVIDLFTGGLSFGAGVALGAGVGAASAWFGSGRIAKHWTPTRTTLAKLFPGEHGHVLALGPIRSEGFAWVLLDRALRHLDAVRHRAHAQQGALEWEAASAPRVRDWPAARQQEVGRFIDLARRAGKSGHGIDPAWISDLSRLLAAQL